MLSPVALRLVYSRDGNFLGCIRVRDLLDLLTPAPRKESSTSPESGMFVARCKLIGSITAGELIGEQRFVDIEAPLMEAVELMTLDELINIPVLRDGELVGMLPDRNLLLEVCNLTRGESSRSIRAGAAAPPSKPRMGNKTARRRSKIRGNAASS